MIWGAGFAKSGQYPMSVLWVAASGVYMHDS